MALAEREGKCGIELGCVERVIDVLELGLGFWLEGRAGWRREVEGWEGDIEQSLKTRDSTDGSWGK